MASFLDKVGQFFSASNNTNDSSNIVYGRQGIYNKAVLNQYSTVKNENVDLNKVEVVSTIYTCIHILASEVQRLPLSIRKKEGKVTREYIEHPFYNALRYSPQAFVKTPDWLNTMIGHLCIEGNSYAYNDGKNLNLLNPKSVLVGTYNDKLWYYNQETSQPMPASAVTHFKFWGKEVKGKALRPIDSLRSELNIEYKAEKTVDNFFSNNAHSTKVLQAVPEMKAGNSKLAELVDDFTKKFAGVDNSGNLIVVPPFYELKELQLNANDIMFLEAAKYSAGAIGALYGVPQYLLGKNDYAGKWEDASAYFRNNTIASLLNLITSELEYKLLTPEQRNSGVYIEFNVNALLATNLTDRMNIYKAIAQQGALSPNEFRSAFHMDVLDKPELDEYYIQGQYQKLSSVFDGTAKLMPPMPEPSDNKSQN